MYVHNSRILVILFQVLFQYAQLVASEAFKVHFHINYGGLQTKIRIIMYSFYSNLESMYYPLVPIFWTSSFKVDTQVFQGGIRR